MKKILVGFGFLVALAFAVIPKVGWAATFSINLGQATFKVGDQFTADVKIDSEDASVNAGQATISFSKDTLQVVSIDKGSSVFNFWLQDPEFDNPGGEITFIGGSTSGFIGKSLEAVKIVFKVVGSGSGNLTFTDGAITASDGSGTNLLSGMKGVQFTIGTTSGVQVIPPGGAQPSTTPAPSEKPLPSIVPPPTQITRPAKPAVVLPVKPALSVSLYPDQAKWYNTMDNFLVSWSLPADVLAVSTAVNKDPLYRPQTSEGLFDNKYFKALDDGTWYLHVSFQNNLGWGQTFHYKISIDTIPPAPFNLRIDESTSTDNPTPTIRYASTDQPSGIDHYRIKVDSEEAINTTDDHLKLPSQAPGNHMITVRAYDRADNITEEKVILQTLPIPGPAITPISQNTYLGSGKIYVSGSAPADLVVLFGIYKETGETISSAELRPDKGGNWSFDFDLPTISGNYRMSATTRDSRGALSFPVIQEFNVRPKPLFVLGNFEVTSGGLAVFLLVLLGGGFFAGYYVQKMAKEQRGRKAIIAERDISVIFTLLQKDIDKMLDNYADGGLTEAQGKEIEFYLKRMKENLDKSKRYMSENVEEIKD